MTKFGIVLPTYNRPELLGRALHSILMTGYKHIVVCVVDDASSQKDLYRKTIQNYSDKMEIVYKRLKKNSGVNIARNIALDILLDAQMCDYITLLDDDDMLIPSVFSKMDRLISKAAHPWIVCKCIDPAGKEITEISYYGEMPYIYYFGGLDMKGDAAHYISSETISDIRFATEIKQGQEWTFFLQLSRYYTMYVVDIEGMIREYIVGGLTDTLTAPSSEEMERLDSKYMYPIGLSRRKLQRLFHKRKILKYLENRDYSEAIKCSLRYIAGAIRNT